MSDMKRRGISIIAIILLILSTAVSSVYADQPNRGTTKHKRSLRNADIGRAENRYTDIDGTTGEADKNTVSINFTSDMEQSMESYARVATYFKAESGHYPRSFLIDAGNYSSSSQFNSAFSQYYPAIQAMGKAGYDIAGIGSSEISQGGKKLSDMLINAAKSGDTLPYVTSANIAGTNELVSAYEKYGVNDYLDMNKYRTEIAVISIVGEDAFNAAAPDKLRYENAVKKARSLVAEIKKDEDADMIICLCASGIGAPDKDKALEKRLAKSVKDIDIIISAGSNTELQNPIKINDTRIFSLALGNKKLGRIEYTIEDNQYKYSGYHTVKLNDKYEKDEEVEKVLKTISDKVDSSVYAANGYSSNQVLCDSFFEIPSVIENQVEQGDSVMGELIADSYRYAAIEDAKIPKGNLIAMSSEKSSVAGIPEGKVKVNDIYNMMGIGKSDNGTRGIALTSFYLYGSDLRILTEIAATSSDSVAAERLYFSGLNYKFNPYRFKDRRIFDITVIDDATGSQIDLKNDTLYRIITDKDTAMMIADLRGIHDKSLNVVPKDENGKKTNSFNELMRGEYKELPLKTWVAMAEYLFTFSEAGIPATYKEPDGRMVYDDSKEFSHVYKGEFFTLLQLVFVALVGIVALVLLILLILNLAGVKIGKKKGTIKKTNSK